MFKIPVYTHTRKDVELVRDEITRNISLRDLFNNFLDYCVFLQKDQESHIGSNTPKEDSSVKMTSLQSRSILY